MLQKRIYISISILFLLLLLTISYSISIQQSLSNKVLRLHILANSNSKFDQELKLKVRDEIVNYLTPLLKNSSNLDETKKIINENITNLQDIANSIVKKYSNYNTNISLATSSFPTKQYGKIAFPAGDYEALKITIGEGSGNNWWCVMFPPLCFTSSSAGEFDDETINNLQNTLSKEEFNMINNLEKPEVKIKFRILEWWNS